MRVFLVVASFMMLQSASIAQKINYNIPEGYESDISKADYKTLVDLSVSLVSSRFKIDHVADGTITLKEKQEMQAMNLHNLIGKCATVTDKSKWKAVVQDHFGNMFKSLDEQKKIDPENFESVRKYLSLRIYPTDYVDRLGGTANLIAKTDLEGTFTILMFDLPGTFAPVNKAVFDLWKKESAAIFRLAQENVNKHEVEKVKQKFKIDGTDVEIALIGEENYAASFVLDLINNSPELVGEWGSVVVIPNKGLVDICKVSRDKPVDFVKFIQGTKSFIEKSYAEHPQRISDQYFWYYKGKFKRIMIHTGNNGSINVISPQGLTELMTSKK